MEKPACSPISLEHDTLQYPTSAGERGWGDDLQMAGAARAARHGLGREAVRQVGPAPSTGARLCSRGSAHSITAVPSDVLVMWERGMKGGNHLHQSSSRDYLQPQRKSPTHPQMEVRMFSGSLDHPTPSVCKRLRARGSSLFTEPCVSPSGLHRQPGCPRETVSHLCLSPAW